MAMNKVKNLFYETKNVDGENRWQLSDKGLSFQGTELKLYESNVPPLLRFFHIRNISPSGWITVSKKYYKNISELNKTTTCDIELEIESYKNIKPSSKEEKVPYKICSFDIEASSSHGAFPLETKNYNTLSQNIVNYWKNTKNYTISDQKILFKELLYSAFGYSKHDFIDLIYIKNKEKYSEEKIKEKIEIVLKYKERRKNSKRKTQSEFFEQHNIDSSSDKKITKTSNYTLIDVLNDENIKHETKLNVLTRIFDKYFPEIEGDKVTFIGSTFLKYGAKKPYLNNCIALDTCDKVAGVEIEQYSTEKEVLLAWTKLIQKEDPDIIIGYNIFGFDYKFMFNRAKEYGNDCVEEFLKLSRNKDEICGKYNEDEREYKINESSLSIASGVHNLEFIKMNGRIQIDLYNYFRREYNLLSYKLDYVSGNFICDFINKIEKNEEKNETKLYSKNLFGLNVGNFIHIEEIGHSSEYYANGAKFKVKRVNKTENYFVIKTLISPNEEKKLKWCLAKDDVTPQDIFRMTNEGSKERAIIAKYCIQDCNLVHHLMGKIDILTGFIEMANICSVPIDFIVMRGQGIKLFSFIAKKCREDDTLIPVLKKKNDGGYEGAIVLEPKCGLYLNEPVACVDYSSLYPSSMISENLSHDSKVWTKEFDLKGQLIQETGIKDDKGVYIYDNLPEHKYVDIEYDTFIYKKLGKSAKLDKVLSGKKLCRFVQLPDNKLSIMPKILKELLYARKETRKSAKFKTIFCIDKKKFTGLIKFESDIEYELLTEKNELLKIKKENVEKISDTYNDFMKNVLDKRQLAIKVTANSLYGQCGARTSNFYEKDVAASTTATGRKLLIYGQKIIEKVYGNKICETKYGTVQSNAEYIYGDTDSVFMSFKLTDVNTGKKIEGKEALKHTIELAKEAGELATSFLKEPHDLEYEKTFMPFCLLSKKRYVGMLYEEDVEKCYRKSMGIVLKRRDNAPIVKDVYGGIIDILMKDKNVSKAISFTKKCMSEIVNEKYPLEKLIITKSLNSHYKNPNQIAHNVLANRIAQRDPGNRPKPGDRIPFIYIETKNNVKLQGERIENPDYIRKHKIKPDYAHYITNQLMKPIQQVFALVLEDIPEYKRELGNCKRKINSIHRKYKGNLEKINTYEQKYRNNEVKKLIFDESLVQTKNTKNKQFRGATWLCCLSHAPVWTLGMPLCISHATLNSTSRHVSLSFGRTTRAKFYFKKQMFIMSFLL